MTIDAYCPHGYSRSCEICELMEHVGELGAENAALKAKLELAENVCRAVKGIPFKTIRFPAASAALDAWEKASSEPSDSKTPK